jgi:hypothetical protein
LEFEPSLVPPFLYKKGGYGREGSIPTLFIERY